MDGYGWLVMDGCAVSGCAVSGCAVSGYAVDGLSDRLSGVGLSMVCAMGGCVRWTVERCVRLSDGWRSDGPLTERWTAERWMGG
eukprot:2544054-Prymnesium_polylepis.2